MHTGSQIDSFQGGDDSFARRGPPPAKNGQFTPFHQPTFGSHLLRNYRGDGGGDWLRGAGGVGVRDSGADGPGIRCFDDEGEYGARLSAEWRRAFAASMA